MTGMGKKSENSLIISLIGICVVHCVFYAAFAEMPEYVVFDNGATDYQIVIAPDASNSEVWVAGRLAAYLEQMSGAAFPVVVVSEKMPATPSIVVGYNMCIDPMFDTAVLRPADEDEGFVIRSQGSHIFILGGKKRGTMYGVFAFLEKELGCRWYSSEVCRIPSLNRYAFRSLDYTEHPATRFRTVDYVQGQDPAIGVPSRLNSQRLIGVGGTPYPGGSERFWFEHTFEIFVPSPRYFDTHPEYFSLREGKRIKDRSQLCLTHPDVLPKMVSGLREFMIAHPCFRVYNIAQNDNQNPCLCPSCQAIVEREGSEAGLMLWFVNQAAEILEEQFPDKYIGTFAYQYTRKPPKTIRPRSNVMIVLCSIECDFSHPFSHPNNQSFVDDLKAWTSITPNVFVWDYVVNYRHYLLPHPNFNVLQENIQILHKHNVIGILEQANYQSYGSEFAELRMYVLSRLLWNPEQDVRGLVTEFVRGYYGQGAEPMLAYFDLVQSLPTDDTYLTYAMRHTDPMFTPSFLEQANALFDCAERAAEEETVLHRIERARLSVLYLGLLMDGRAAIDRGDLERFEAIVQRERVTFISEGTTMAEFIATFRQQYTDK